MKLKYIITAIAATLALAVGCQKEQDSAYLKEIQVSSSFLAFPPAGGPVDITLNATESWQISGLPEWITATPSSGSAGETSVHFTASATTDTRDAVFTIECGGKTQRMNVIQMTEAKEPEILTCKDVIALVQANQAIAQEVYFKGVVCKIDEISPSYGNATFYLSDDGSFKGSYNADGSGNDNPNWVEVYRGKWLNGANFTSGDEFGIGDEMVVTGIIVSYKGTPETNQGTASVVSIKKSLIDVAELKFDKLPAADTTFTLTVTAKESPLLLTSDSDWLQIIGVTSDGSYQLHADENPKTAERKATISIVGPTARKSVSITQKGVPATGASVSEIIAQADGSKIETLPSTVVVALTTKGAVFSDGTKAIYAFGDKAAALSLGDGVKVSAEKTTYNGVPELTNITGVFVDSQGNTFSYPEAKDITATAGSYSATEAEYIQLSGTLTVSDDGKYYNLSLDGMDGLQGSINYPVDALDAKSFDGKKITVTGYFNGHSSNKTTGMQYINIIATKIVEYVDNPKGTATNPYTASEIAALLLGGTTFDSNVYVKGVVSAVQSEFSSGYGNGTFWISDDGTAYGVSEDKKSTTEPTKDFECYRVLWFNNQKWADGSAQVTVGDEVVVCGALTTYNGIAETNANKAWVYSVNGATSEANGLGNLVAPFTAVGACEAVNGLSWTSNTEYEKVGPFYVKGKISRIANKGTFTEGGTYGNATFYISEDGSENNEFQCFRVLYLGNKKFAEGQTDIQLGDEVIIYGELMNYKGNTPETVSGSAYLYSLNGKTE